MSDALEPMSQVDLLTMMAILLDQYEQHPANKGKVTVRLTLGDPILEAVWENGSFGKNIPGMCGQQDSTAS
ncbi:hypothetical protein G6L37_07330 [Agrobacterium rubi]|nr:hypothetical protein [Agrobacterium rubi]NTF25179.1 hypothetical protein [Agrobacterium rubi]